MHVDPPDNLAGFDGETSSTFRLREVSVFTKPDGVGWVNFQWNWCVFVFFRMVILSTGWSFLGCYILRRFCCSEWAIGVFWKSSWFFRARLMQRLIFFGGSNRLVGWRWRVFGAGKLTSSSKMNQIDDANGLNPAIRFFVLANWS